MENSQTVEEKMSQDNRTKWDRKVPGEQLRVDKAGILDGLHDPAVRKR